MLSKLLGALTGAAVLTTGALAQDFPSRPVTMVMPYAAGGPGDTISRLVAQGMTASLKQQVIVENISGASGSIGSAKVASSTPDGHTLLMIHVSHATNVAFIPNLKYDPIKDFEPVGLAVETPSAFVAKKDFPPRTFGEMIAYVKANSEKVNYAHAGIGSASHLCGLLFSSAIETKMTNVAYRGTGPAVNDLIGSQVDLMCDQVVNVGSHVLGGSIKGYAVTGTERAPALPDLPTAAEAGLPDFTVKIWFGLFAPKGTPKPVLDQLVSSLNDALKDPTVKGKLAALGAETVSPDRAQPEALRTHLKAEIDKWGSIIKKAGLAGAQ